LLIAPTVLHTCNRHQKKEKRVADYQRAIIFGGVLPMATTILDVAQGVERI